MTKSDLHGSSEHDTIGIMDVEEQEEKSIIDTLLYFWNIVWAYRALIIALTTLGAVGTVTYAVMTIKLMPSGRSPLPDYFESYTRVIIQESGSATGGDSVAMMMDMMGFSSNSRSQITNGNLAQMVYWSKPYVDAVTERLDFDSRYGMDSAESTRRLFYSKTDFSFDNASRVMKLSCTDTDKYFATQVVEVMLEELQVWFREEGGAASQAQISSIEEKIFEVNQEIHKLEDQIKAIQTKYSVLSINDLAQMQQEQINEQEMNLTELDLKISQLTSSQPSYSTIETSAVKELRRQKEDVQNILYRLKNGYAVSGRTYPPVEELPNLSLEFNRLQLLLQVQERIYLTLTEQYETMKLSGAGSLALTVLDPAEIPEEKSGPRRSMICVQGTGIMFFLGVALAFLFTFIKTQKSKRVERLEHFDD